MLVRYLPWREMFSMVVLASYHNIHCEKEVRKCGIVGEVKWMDLIDEISGGYLQYLLATPLLFFCSFTISPDCMVSRPSR